MLLAFVLVLIVIGIGIMGSMYSIFLPFFQNLGDMTDYNVAYYGANSSIERGMLVLKYQDPGFEGSGGRVGGTSFGPSSDGEVTSFSRFNYPSNGMYWEIRSRTQAVPAAGEGNIPYFLSANDSEDYNSLGYQDLESLVLSVDNTTTANDFYSYESDPRIASYAGTEVLGTIRIPPKVYEKFGNNDNALLCDQLTAPCDINGDGITNEKAITWSVEGVYSPGLDDMKFEIIPRTAIFYNQNPPAIDILRDSNFREDAINYTTIQPNYPPNLEFSNNLLNDYNPVVTNNPYLLSGHNVLAEDETLVNGLKFGTLFQNSYSKLNFFLNYLMLTRGDQIYPFLEYKFDFDAPVADRFYSVYGVGKVGSYEVEIVAKKPTSDKTTAGDFTIIF